jgi:soluble lytic murein transglycosylase-like protein
VGRHSKPSRIQLPHARPSIAATAAAPTLAGVVAAFVLSQPGTSAAPRADARSPGSAPHGAAAETAGSSTVSEAQLLAAARRAVAPKAAAAPAISYTVQPGDTLSSIAARFYHNAAAWPALFWANHGGGSGAIQWADDIHSGQVLTIPREPAQIPSPPAQLAPAYSPRHASTTPVVAQSPSPPAQAPAPAGGWPTSDGVYTGPVPGGAFGQCVVSRESGGQPQVMNSSGHYGLYQFSASTWAEYGGNPADFGHASVAEQNQVFANALAAGGENNWAPYDGC